MAPLVRLTLTFLWLSVLCVGGGLGVLPEMQRQVVGHEWVTAREFVDGYTLSQVTPGPNMLVAVFVGYRVYGVTGACLAGLAMFLPTSSLTGFVARRWERLRTQPWVLATERALGPIGIGLMAAGVYTLARGAVHDGATAVLAGAAALALTAQRVPPVAVVLAGGVAGWLLGL
jgi:chromate transporter